MIDLLDVSKFFGNRVIFDQVNCHFKTGGFHHLYGANGSGKTTLFSLLLRLQEPDAGQVLVLQRPLEKLSRRQVEQHRQHIGVIPQKQRFFAKRSVKDNLMILGRVAQKPKEATLHNAQFWAETLNIMHYFEHPIDQLSLGEKQCVAIARALVHDPILVLADNPTQHLTPEASRQVWQVLEHLNALGTTVIVATSVAGPELSEGIQQWHIQKPSDCSRP